MLPYLAAVIAAASLTACSEQKHEEITITQDETGTAGVISIDLEAQADGTAQEAAPAAVGTLIESQTFDVTLDGWGAVQFASYAPEEGMIRGDVSFFLMRDGQAIYELPAWWDGQEAPWRFESVEMVAFRDANGDGQKDIIMLVSYITGAGQTAAVPFNTTRIYLSDGAGFTPDRNLSEAIDEANANDSIGAIMDYVTNHTVGKSAGTEAGEPGEATAMDPIYEASGIRERDAQTFFKLLLGQINAGEKEKVAGQILFPRKVIALGNESVVQSAQEFLVYYDEIFTPEFVKQLNEQSGETLFGNYMGVSYGNGLLWIQEVDGVLKIAAVNNGEERNVIYPGEPGIQPG